MKKVILTLFLVFLISKSFAQITSEKKYATTAEQYGREIFQTADSGYLVQGTIEKGWRNCYLIKTDSTGQTQWTKTFGTDSIQYYCVDMASTQDGGYKCK